MQYRTRAGASVAPGAVSEAIGQLASWLCLERNGFSARPVFLFADKIAVLGQVAPGDTVELEAELHAMDGESLRFSGKARAGGRVIQEIRDCSGYFMPLAVLEDPEVTKGRFAALTGGGLVLDGSEGEAYPFDKLAGATVELDRAKVVRTRQTFSENEPFYADHFPRFAVTPIVMLNEMIGAATARLLGMPDTRYLKALSIEGIKIRSFVRPGDECETVVRAEALEEADGKKLLRASAEILKDGRRILRGLYQYEVTE